MDKPSCLFIYGIIKGADDMQTGCMENVQEDLLTLARLGVNKKYIWAAKIITVR